jgi:hypothetical protein
MAQWATAKFNNKAHKARQFAQILESKSRGLVRWGSDWAILRQVLQEMNQ